MLRRELSNEWQYHGVSMCEDGDGVRVVMGLACVRVVNTTIGHIFCKTLYKKECIINFISKPAINPEKNSEATPL